MLVRFYIVYLSFSCIQDILRIIERYTYLLNTGGVEMLRVSAFTLNTLHGSAVNLPSESKKLQHKF